MISWFHLLSGLGARALLNPDETTNYVVTPDVDINQGLATQMHDEAARTRDVVDRNVKRAFTQDSGGRKAGKAKEHIRKVMSVDSDMDTIMSSEDPEAALAEALENTLEQDDETLMNQLSEDEVHAGLITELTAKVADLDAQTATELLECCNWGLADAEVLHTQINELLAIGALAVDFGSIMEDLGHSGYNDTSQVTIEKLQKIYTVMKVLEEMMPLKVRRKFIAKAALQRALWDTASAEEHINNVKTLVDAIVAKRATQGGEYDMLAYVLENVATEEVVGYDIDVAYKDYIVHRRHSKRLTQKLSSKEGYVSAWLGPKDNIWSTTECMVVGTNESSRTLDQCKSDCQNEALCNTISFKQDGGYCVKQSCPEPVEEPETAEPGYLGYALIGFKEAAENCRCAGSYEKEKSYFRKLGEDEINIGGCAQQCASIPNCAAFVVWTGKLKLCEIRTGACPPPEKPELCEQEIPLEKGQTSIAYNKLIISPDKSQGEGWLDFAALGAIATSSTKAGGSEPAWIIDGGFETSFNYGTCAATTRGQDEAWYEVDLLKPYHILKVAITNIQAGGSERQNYSHLFVDGKKCATVEGMETTRARKEFICDEPMWGQVIRIEKVAAYLPADSIVTFQDTTGPGYAITKYGEYFMDELCCKLDICELEVAELIYSKTEKQQYCSTATELKEYAQCWQAARDLGLSFGEAFHGTGDHRYCFHAEDERNKVYFNTAEDDAAASPPNPAYASICHVSSDEPQALS